MTERTLGWLATRTTADLARLMRLRPDLLGSRPPATLADLAARADHPASVLAALDALPRPAWQVWEAAIALGEHRDVASLLRLLGADPGALDAVLGELGARALVRRGSGGVLDLPAFVAEWPSPLGLPGPPLRVAWAGHPVAALQSALRALGRPAPSRKAEAFDALVGALADAGTVLPALTGAPTGYAAELRAWAAEEASPEDDDRDDGWYADPERWQRRRSAERWAVSRGLAVGHSYGHLAVLPSEVALALRGDAYRAPFDPAPPPLPTRPVAQAVVDGAAAAAVTGLLQLTTRLLTGLERSPAAAVAAGGLGVRELRRLTRECAADEVSVRLALEVAAAADLVELDGKQVRCAPAAAGWLDSEPAEQCLQLVQAWWSMGWVATEERDGDGGTLRPLSHRVGCPGCRAARTALLAAADQAGPGAAPQPAALVELTRWNRPQVHVLPQDAERPLDTVWRELHLVGAVGAGAVSPLGRALVAGDDEALLRWLTAVLPGRTDRVSFGSDLTALVAGAPARQVAALLDSCADRESTGGAVTWRFTQATVRRALDAGTPPAALLEQLAATAERALPQALEYLVRDLGRRHGVLRVGPVTSVVTSQDTALLAEVAADRRLAALGARLLSPTALACSVDESAVLTLMRSAGYLPMPEATGQPAPDPSVGPPAARRTSRRSTPRGGRADDADGPPGAAPDLDAPDLAAPDLDALAERLLAAGPAAVAMPWSSVAVQLSAMAPHLGPAEIDLLAEAVETAGRVQLTYRSAAGSITQRVVDDPLPLGGSLHAWCELREDDRVFTVSRILAVAPARD